MSGFTKDSLQGFLHARRSQPTERRAADISRLCWQNCQKGICVHWCSVQPHSSFKLTFGIFTAKTWLGFPKLEIEEEEQSNLLRRETVSIKRSDPP